MFQVSDDSSEKVVQMSNYKSDQTQRTEQKDDQKTATPKAVCEGGVCRLEWKPTRPANTANAA